MGAQIIDKAFAKIKTICFGEFPKLSYSRSGEDLLLDDIFRQKSTGLYVDIGAFHPVKYSNTYKFYLKGWRGINIDPNKEVIDLFKKIRPGDINLNLAVSTEPGTLDYFMNQFDPSMNTISEKFAQDTSRQFGFEISEKRSVSVKRLDQIVGEAGIDQTKIDFLNIDVEGHDYEVLRSGNWDVIRPRIVMVEMNCDLGHLRESVIYQFMVERRYVLLSFIFINPEFGNGIFINQDQ